MAPKRDDRVSRARAMYAHTHEHEFREENGSFSPSTEIEINQRQRSIARKAPVYYLIDRIFYQRDIKWVVKFCCCKYVI